MPVSKVINAEFQNPNAKLMTNNQMSKMAKSSLCFGFPHRLHVEQSAEWNVFCH
jgi:hypothetical protein